MTKETKLNGMITKNENALMFKSLLCMMTLQYHHVYNLTFCKAFNV